MNKQEQILLMGLGNPLLTDDGIGPKIVDRLRFEFTDPKIVFSNISVGGMELIELMRDYKKVFFIDAARSVNGVLGEVRLMTTSDFEETLHLSNFHDLDFLTAIELARQMEIPITKDVHVISIEIAEDQVFSDDFSDPIREKYEEIYEYVKNTIANLL